MTKWDFMSHFLWTATVKKKFVFLYFICGATPQLSNSIDLYDVSQIVDKCRIILTINFKYGKILKKE